MKIAISTNKYLLILESISLQLKRMGHEIIAINNGKEMDIFDAAVGVAQLVSTGKVDRGIIIDEYGSGGFMVADKFPHTIVAQLYDEYSAYMTREHNNTNIITLGGELTGPGLMRVLVEKYIKANFCAGRHLVRTDMLEEMLKKEEC